MWVERERSNRQVTEDLTTFPAVLAKAPENLHFSLVDDNLPTAANDLASS